MTQQQSRNVVIQILIGIICTVLMVLAGPVQNQAFSAITQVTTTTGGDNVNPSINADGTRVAFDSDRDITGGNADNNNEIFIFDTTTGFTQVTTTTVGSNLRPSINADGTRVAFISRNDITGGNAD
ncbi:MAG: TolB family protein, partial [Planctomycetota bacterium]